MLGKDTDARAWIGGLLKLNRETSHRDFKCDASLYPNFEPDLGEITLKLMARCKNCNGYRTFLSHTEPKQ